MQGKLIIIVLIMFLLKMSTALGQSKAVNKNMGAKANVKTIVAIKPDTTKRKLANIVFLEDSGITYLMKTFPLPGDNKKISQGYRIQVIASTSRDLVYQTNTKLLESFPDLNTKVVFQTPYFKLRVGEYGSIAEAQPLFKKIKKQFPSAFIVPDQIIR